jgi:hypothetical protein
MRAAIVLCFLDLQSLNSPERKHGHIAGIFCGVGAQKVRRPRLAGGEGVSQSPLKDKEFSTFPDQHPQFELRRDTFAPDKRSIP